MRPSQRHANVSFIFVFRRESLGALFPPGDSSGVEIEMSRPPTQIVVVGVGHWRGEGMALVEAIK